MRELRSKRGDIVVELAQQLHDWNVPLWVSVVGVLVPGFLAYEGIRLSKHRTDGCQRRSGLRALAARCLVGDVSVAEVRKK